MTFSEMHTLVPGQKVKIIDALNPSGVDANGIGYNFNRLFMSKYLGQVVTVLAPASGVADHILIEEDAGGEGTRRDREGRWHWMWKYNVLEFPAEDDTEPDDTASNDGILGILFPGVSA